MCPKSAREKSIEKVKLLRDPLVSAAFLHYFQRNWEAQGILDELRSTGADIELLREWALFSFESLGTDEPEEKRKRGLMMQRQLKKAVVGYENAIAFYSVHASAPDLNFPEYVKVSNEFKALVVANQDLACKARSILQTAATTGVYRTKRFGVNWQSPYLYLSKSYVRRLTNWDERKLLGTLTHLTAAAYKSVHRRAPHDLRSLLRKALQAFENDPRNAIIIGRLRKGAAEPRILSELFPPLSSSPT
jgi:hypothetical protein